MARATFSNIRNKDTSNTTLYVPFNREMEIYDASQLYKQNNIPLIIIAGSNYGSGPSRDWAVKGQWFLVSYFKSSNN
jgi:aconitate hydratase